VFDWGGALIAVGDHVAESIGSFSEFITLNVGKGEENRLSGLLSLHTNDCCGYNSKHQ
jgi:hypothetical protein